MPNGKKKHNRHKNTHPNSQTSITQYLSQENKDRATADPTEIKAASSIILMPHMLEALLITMHNKLETLSVNGGIPEVQRQEMQALAVNLKINILNNETLLLINQGEQEAYASQLKP
jgi:hypothetical protein